MIRSATAGATHRVGDRQRFSIASLCLHRGIPSDAKTLEAAMQIEDVVSGTAKREHRDRRTDASERAAEKQRSRDEDARALASGEKTREQLRSENSHFRSRMNRSSGARPVRPRTANCV